jgi:hypothetical protein
MNNRAISTQIGSTSPLVAAFLAVLLAILPSGCGQSSTDDGTGHATSPAPTGTPSTSDAQACRAGIQFQAANSGVSDADLQTLARRLDATEPQSTEPSPGLKVSLNSSLLGAGHIVYRVAWTGGLWKLELVQVCPGPRFAKTCGRVVEYRGHHYRLERAKPGVVFGVGSPLGVGWALGCSPKRVGPIGIYGASEQPVSEAITVTWDDVVHMYDAT